MIQLFAYPLVAAVVAQVSAQVVKVILYSVSERRFAANRFLSASGMPSAHSAFVTALATSIGVKHGVQSDIFAVSAVFAAIVVYDSFRLRGQVQRHAEVLNQLLKPRLDVSAQPVHGKATNRTVRLSEHVGHTVPEIIAGVAWGILIAWL